VKYFNILDVASGACPIDGYRLESNPLPKCFATPEALGKLQAAGKFASYSEFPEFTVEGGSTAGTVILKTCLICGGQSPLVPVIQSIYAACREIEEQNSPV